MTLKFGSCSLTPGTGRAAANGKVRRMIESGFGVHRTTSNGHHPTTTSSLGRATAVQSPVSWGWKPAVLRGPLSLHRPKVPTTSPRASAMARSTWLLDILGASSTITYSPLGTRTRMSLRVGAAILDVTVVTRSTRRTRRRVALDQCCPSLYHREQAADHWHASTR